MRALRLAAALALCACAAPKMEADGPSPSGADAALSGPPIANLGGPQVANVDRSVDPCTDFYAFSNGGWRKANPIPDGKPRWGVRALERARNRAELQQLLEELAAKTDWPRGSVEQLLSDHYASCMDEARIEAAGLQPLAPLLAGIAAAKSSADVQRSLRRLHELGIPIGFTASAAYDYRAPLRTLLNLAAGGLGLPDRNDYLSAEPKFVEERAKYRAHIARMLELGGVAAAQARDEAESIVLLETRLAEAALDSQAAADPLKTEHALTFAQLASLTPSIAWAAYFDEAKLPRGVVNLAEPKLLAQLDRELGEANVAVWKAYLTFQLLDAEAPDLSKAFAQERFDFAEKFLNGVATTKPRAVRCMESTEALLGEPLGRAYAAKHLPPAAKAKADEIGRELIEALREDVAAAQWMEPATRQIALEKVATLHLQLGYPAQWKDTSSLQLGRDGFFANVAQEKRYGVADDRSHVGKATDPNNWVLPPSSPDAYLDLQLNELVLPAGFLQPPLFDPQANDAVILGSFGVNLAHDITHSVDATGAEQDVQGHPTPWWTPADRAQYQQRTQCVVDQYEGFFIEPGVHHHGKQILNEAMGDLGGLHLALQVLEKKMAAHPNQVPVRDGFTPEQQLFIAWGQVRGEEVRLEAQRQMIKSDIHATPAFRIAGALAGTPEFARAFSCKPGAPMVLPPERRCSLW